MIIEFDPRYLDMRVWFVARPSHHDHLVAAPLHVDCRRGGAGAARPDA